MACLDLSRLLSAARRVNRWVSAVRTASTVGKASRPDAEAHSDRLLEQLRKEIDSQKSCFTQHTDQAVKFATATVPLIVAASNYEPLVAPTAIFVTLVLLGVSRTGLYKYTSANRNTAYQLHLARIRHLHADSPRLLRAYLTVDWEEACRAWRIIQPALFTTVYYVRQYSWLCRKIKVLSHFHPRLYTRRIDPRDPKYKWAFPAALTAQEPRAGETRRKAPRAVTDPGAQTYYAGSYLRNAQEKLGLMQIFSLLPLILATQLKATSETPWLEPLLWSIALVFLILIGCRWIVTSRRVRILEQELGSIHSCSIVWHAVIAAHLLTRQCLLAPSRKVECRRFQHLGHDNPSWQDYTQAMALLARDLVTSTRSIHPWIEEREEGLEETKEGHGFIF